MALAVPVAGAQEALPQGAADARPAEGRPTEARLAELRPAEARLAELRHTEARLAELRPAETAPTRVALASPDPTLRMQLRRLLPTPQGFEIVGSTRFGGTLRETLAQFRPDTLVVDARHDLPGAVAALEMARHQAGRIVVLHEASRPTTGSGTITLACPAELAQERVEGSFAQQLMAAVRVAAPQPAPQGAVPAQPAAPALRQAAAPAPGAARPARPRVVLQALAPQPEVIAFGSSTGGPPALIEVFRMLGRGMRVPMMLTQHMPPRFTAMLAQQISQVGATAHEAEQGMPLLPGHLYVAPGGQHLTLQRRERELICALDDGPPENFCKPAVDVMLRSVAQVCRGRCLVVILTGMGSDGLLGSRRVVEAGGTVLAQDEATSVVWGMPGAVATAGICRAVLPLAEVAPAIRTMVPG